MSDSSPLSRSSENERRQSFQDRRTKPRQGKLERRRHRCGGCQFYGDPNASPIPLTAQCQKHNTQVGITDFACRLFKPVASLL